MARYTRPAANNMLASVLISAVCLILLLYWFRYTCLLLLQTNPMCQHASSAARANRLAFPAVQKALAAELDEAALDALQHSLDNDYRIVLYLLHHSSGMELPAMERTMLTLDYRLMQLWYRLARRSSAERARQALLEMSQVVGYFSQKMGERVANQAAA